ncbi:MFS transporter [Pseudomonas aeruginosa]|nr:MFS transporter [Pseudomonas aeruginosa]
MSSQPSSLLRHRPFLAFWLARVCTASGFQMLTVAIGWHIYELTGNVLDLGLVGLVEFLPRVLFMLHTGHVADRYDRRRIAALCQAGQALVAVALVLGAASGEITRNMIFVLAFALGTARAFEMPTTQALLPNLVPAGLFPRAVAASASAMQAATIAAPALGGLLYAFGASWVYVPTATLYVLACVLTLSLPVRNQPLTQGKATLDSLLAGIRFIRSRPDIFGAISLDLFAVLLGGATALLPVFAKDILLTGPWGLGLAALGSSGGRPGDVVLAGALQHRTQRRADHVPLRGHLRPGNHRLRPVEIVLAVPRRAGGTRRRGHGQHGHPRRLRAARDPRRDARPGQRGERPVHRRLGTSSASSSPGSPHTGSARYRQWSSAGSAPWWSPEHG